MSERPKLQLEQLKDVVLVLNDVTEWYRLGLQLGLPVHMLDAIKALRLSVQNSMLDMVHRWLSYDPEASWEKLAKALDAIAEKVVAENIRRQFLGAVAAAAQNLDDEPETRLILGKIKSSFSLLVTKVRSAMEDNQVKIKDVQEFLLTYHEGECSIPDVPDLSKIFASITKAKLWRYDHYSLLENVAESFLPDDHPALAKITEYDHQLAGFRETTRIIDFIKVSDQEDPEDDGHPISPKRYNRRYRKLTAKVKIDPSVPLDYVEKLWKALMKKFNLPELTAIIDKIEEGSLSITWLVLPHIAEKIRATCYKSITFFQQHNILEITLYGSDGLYLYHEEWMQGSTPLYWASFTGNTEETEALLEAGADINEKNDNATGHTPLIGACIGCGDINTQSVRLLLTRGAVVDAQAENGGSALMMASIYGHTGVVELLLEHKAQVNLLSDNEDTALMWACSYGNTETVQMLLAHGAIIDLREKETWFSALMYASIIGNTDTVKVLLKHGATVDLTNDDGRTALMCASSYGLTDIAQVLLEGGAAVNIKDNDGVTALWWACDGDYPDTVKLLVDFKADVNLPYDREDGGTVLTVRWMNIYKSVN